MVDKGNFYSKSLSNDDTSGNRFTLHCNYAPNINYKTVSLNELNGKRREGAKQDWK